jgi:hypothetical protein
MVVVVVVLLLLPVRVTMAPLERQQAASFKLYTHRTRWPLLMLLLLVVLLPCCLQHLQASCAYRPCCPALFLQHLVC